MSSRYRSIDIATWTWSISKTERCPYRARSKYIRLPALASVRIRGTLSLCFWFRPRQQQLATSLRVYTHTVTSRDGGEGAHCRRVRADPAITSHRHSSTAFLFLPRGESVAGRWRGECRWGAEAPVGCHQGADHWARLLPITNSRMQDTQIYSKRKSNW